MTPRIDWFDTPALLPSRSGSSSAPNQKSTEVWKSIAAAKSVSPPAVPTDVQNARHCRVTAKWTMKIAGVSLIAAANPTSMPYGTLRNGRHRVRSASTKNTRNASTCPNRKPSVTGSIWKPIAIARPNVSGRHHSGLRHQRAPTIQTIAILVSACSAYQIQPTRWNGSNASGTAHIVTIIISLKSSI